MSDAVYRGLIALILLIPFDVDLRRLGLGIPFVNTTLEILSVALVTGFLVGKIRKKQLNLKKTCHNLPIGLFVLCCLVSSLFSPAEVFWAVKCSLKILLSVLVYFVVVENVTGRARLKTLMSALFFSAAVVAALGILERVFPHSMGSFLSFFNAGQFRLKEIETLRVKSTFAFPNTLSMFLEMVILLFTGTVLLKEEGLKIKTVLFVLLLGEALILTYSRGGLISVTCALMFVFFISRTKPGLKDRAKRVLAIAGIMGLLFVLTGIFDNVFQKRFLSIFSRSYLSNRERVYLWESAVSIIGDYPLLGVGPDDFRWVYAKKYARDAPYSTLWFSEEGVPSHNSNSMFLEMGSDTGIAGLGIFLVLTCGIFACVFRAFKKPSNQFVLCLIPGFIGAFAVFFLHGMIDCFFYYLPVLLLFWVLMGMVASLVSPDREGGLK